MIIDNSRANAFRVCPLLYFYQYEAEGTGLQKTKFPGEHYSALQFGSRVHELLEEHYNPNIAPYPESSIAALEIEAQMMLAGYKTHYPVEPDIAEIVDVERNFRLALPDSEHEYIGKMDLIFRMHDGTLNIMDHKTQERSAKSNDPRKWAARDQASLYIWAAERYYGEKIANFYVNALLRQSEAGLKPAMFPDRQKLERTPAQIQLAVRDLTYVADQICDCRKRFSDSQWPSNRENCYTWGQCEFYQPDTYGWSDEIRLYKFEKKEEYLTIPELKVIQ